MTNFEKYKDEILEITAKGHEVGVKNNTIMDCTECDCTECDYYNHDCHYETFKWLYEEYKEPVPKLTEREMCFLKYIQKGYVTKELNGEVWWWGSKPRKHNDMWLAPFDCHRIRECSFTFIKWEDEEPWSVEDLLKLEVMKDE